MADNKRSGNPNAAQNLSEEDRQKGGEIGSSNQDMSDLGRKGGEAAQQSGNAHELTDEERSEGGSESGGNFANEEDNI